MIILPKRCLLYKRLFFLELCCIFLRLIGFLFGVFDGVRVHLFCAALMWRENLLGDILTLALVCSEMTI